jgi:replicative DNA helicase
MPKEKEGQTKIDFEFFENIIALQCLTNESYLASVLDHLNPSYFLNKDIRTVVQVLKDFYIKRNSVPSLTEIKQYLTTEELKASFRNVVNGFKDLDRKFNDDELNENTERFLKERGIYNTMREVADDCARGKIDSAYILEKFEKCCSIALTRDVGHDYFAQLDKHIADLKQVDRTISTGYPWLDKKLGGGIQELSLIHI